MWSWGGQMGYGRLGHNNAVSYSSPVQIGTSTDWSRIGSGSYAHYAIKAT